MELSERGKTEQAMSPLWALSGAFIPERVDFYTRLVVESTIGRNKAVVTEFIAAMMLESGLDNLIVGNNAVNGSNNAFLGIGWCQLDTGYHVADLDQMHTLRSDPLQSLLYILRTPDLCYVGKYNTYFNKKRWHAWDAQRIDPQQGWSPLEATMESYDRIYGG